MDKYSLEYEKLNEGQKQAVKNIEGPMLVIAGPGTGKTQLLAMRVANILKQTDASASSILCLTFTNKAAVNMKDRIIKLTGGAGAKVVVKTFHSFAHEVMNSYPDNFWNNADMTIAPETIQLDIIESIISRLPLDNPLALKFSGQYTLTKDIQKSINLAKDAGLTPEKLQDIIESNINYISKIEPEIIAIFSARLSAKTLDGLYSKVESLPDQNLETSFPLLSLKQTILSSLETSIEADRQENKTKCTSTLKQSMVQNVAGTAGMHKERTKNLWWLELARVYKLYRDEMHARGFYDFSDMLVEVIGQLEANPEMLADLQERFLYVLIDEFQDSNAAQLKFAQSIADHFTSEGKPNFMVVGDDDQSIYKFNGAELSNMLSFKRQYPSGNLVVLRESYRSSQAVLDQAKKVIELAEQRLVDRIDGLDKQLVANNKNIKSDIQATTFDSREEQLSFVASQVAASYKQNKSIAVLARNHDSLIKMSSLLDQLQIPVSYERQSNILEHDIVEQTYYVIKLLCAVDEGDDAEANVYTHKIIRHPMWGIGPADLWALARNNLRQPNWLDSLKEYNKQTSDLADWFLWLAQESSRQPLAVTLEHILGLRGNKDFVSPMKEYFRASKNEIGEYFLGLSAIQLLRSLVRDFSKSNQPNLADFIRFFDVNIDNQKIIADESPFVTGEPAVQLLTVHKAKGLEFDQVYIVDAIEKNWQPSKGSRKPPLNLPLQPVGDDNDDYVRLLYVAITRAKRDVYLSAYSQDHAGAGVAISSIAASSFDIKSAVKSNQKQLIEILEHHLHWPDLNRASELDILKHRLQTYNLSVTDLLNFMDLSSGGPRFFKERNLLRLPEAKNPSLSHGSAMHAALQYAQILTNQSKFSLPSVIDKYVAALESEYLSVAEHTRFSKLGKQMLERLFIDFNYKLQPGSKPEQKLSDIAVGQARLSGKLDRIDELEDSIVVVDYKTGKGVSNLNTGDKSKQIQAWKYKTQLAFYQILIDNSGKFSLKKQFAGKMVFVETEVQKNLEQTYQPSSEELERLTKLIQAVWQKIINLDLPETNQYPPDFSGIIKFENDLIDNKI